MNRTIKFRGKRIDNGEWVFGDLHTHDCTEIIVHDGYRAESCYPVDSDTVSQFTGLYDKNVNEIYEGDILHEDYPAFDYEVFWDEVRLNFEYHRIGQKQSYSLSGLVLKYYKVIGNIYDNKELMKGVNNE